MEWIVIGLVALFLLSRGGNYSAQTASPTDQQGGASLSNALGNASAPPSYFASGNPQYNAPSVSTVAPVAALPVESQIAAPPTSATTSTAPRISSPPSPTQVSNLMRAGEANRFAPPVVQPVAVRTRVVGPETASAFWTTTPIRVARPSVL